MQSANVIKLYTTLHNFRLSLANFSFFLMSPVLSGHFVENIVQRLEMKIKATGDLSLLLINRKLW